MKNCFYKVADFTFSVSIPRNWDIDRLLPSFRSFRIVPCCEEIGLFTFTVVSQMPEVIGKVSELDLSDNDLGQVRLLKIPDGYRIELTYGSKTIHCMQTDSCFTYARTYIWLQDAYASEAIVSLLRIIYSQAILCHGGISIHASAVVLDESGYLFLGKSGTGKSTHASLWLKCFPESELLNDDNPILRIFGKTVYVYGSPWSGKTPCYKNKRYELRGVVRLVQAQINNFTLQEEVDAFIALLPGCSAIHKDTLLYNYLCYTLTRLVELIPIGVLECRPDKEAALLCAVALINANR